MAIIRFGPEGWRERLGDQFDAQHVARAADGLGAAWAEKSPRARVYVGYDTRRDAATLAAIAAGVLASWGLEVVLSATSCPLPTLAYTCAHDEAACGALMLTASGAAADYQGVVVRDASGLIPSSEFLRTVEGLIPADAPSARATYETANIVEPYISTLLSAVDVAAIQAARPTVVVDPMYGAGQGILSRALRMAGTNIVEIHNEVRPDFDGLHPRPIEPWLDECDQACTTHNAWAGIALDGDADRLGMVDGQGRFITVHRQAPLILSHLVEGREEHGRVVMQMNGSAYLSRQAHRLGCPLSVVPIGFENCYRDLSRPDALLGCGEQGGIAHVPHFLERDGLMVGMLLVEMLAQRGATLAELVAEMDADLGPMSYGAQNLNLDVAQVQTLRNILPGLNPAHLAGKVPERVSHADGLRLDFEDGSWVQLRPSRTKSLVRIYAEAPTPATRDALLRATSEACEQSVWH